MTNPADKILAIDIGGSKIKATVLDMQGNLMIEYKKIETPMPATPDRVLTAIKTLTKNFPPFDKIAAGFPGYVKEGVIITAPNLDTNYWKNINLAKILGETFNKPARVVNDADMLGLGVLSGKGLEMMVTLGTGFGTAFLKNGVLLPHLELAHHPVTKKKTYDNYVGERALQDIGAKNWNRRMKRVIEILKTVFNYDTLYIGGGNASKLRIPLDDNIKIVTNLDGIDGGVKLWEQDDKNIQAPTP